MIPKHTLDLSQEPLKRWEFLLAYKTQIVNLEKSVIDNLGDLSFYERILSGIIRTFSRVWGAAYYQDLSAISTILEIDLGRLIMMQLVYEASTCCTSLVYRNKDGQLVHFRTMDWGMDLLKPMTINLDVVKDGKHLYSHTTWAGYIGCLTALSPNYSISVNFRKTPSCDAGQTSFGDNLWNLLKWYWPVGYMVRYTLENCHDFDSAKKQLSQGKLIAPTYFTLCGKNNACVITRATNHVVSTRFFKDKILVQTNIDHGNTDRRDNILLSMERENAVLNKSNQIINASVSELWDIFSDFPILNDITIYGTIMKPSDGLFISQLSNGVKWIK